MTRSGTASSSRTPMPRTSSQGPLECALVLAVPLSQPAFLRDLQDSRYDFARHVADNYPGAIQPYRLGYEGAVNLILAVARDVERMGVTVLREATLADLKQLFGACGRGSSPAVITLVAHWRFAPVEASDILDPAAILDLLSGPQTELTRRCRQALVPVWDSLVCCKEAPSCRELLGPILNGVLALQTSHRCGEGYWINRGNMEEEFGPALRAGKCVEFRDGLH